MSDTIWNNEIFNANDVVAQYGSPTWIYDRAVIEKRISEIKSFDVIRYAQKANSNLALLSIMKKQGVVVDAVSAGEVERAMRVGYTTDGEHPGVVFTADVLDDDAIEVIKKYNVPVNIGSPDMLDQLAEAGILTDITIRLNPGFGHGHSQKVNTGGDISKHGIWHSQLAEVIQKGKDLGHNMMGLHMHIGSGSDFHHLSQVCDAMVKAAEAFGHGLKVISAGGGLPIPYHKDRVERIDVEAYYKLWDEARKQIEAQQGHSVTLEVEPGRYLIAESCHLVTKIRSVKKQDQRNFYLIDAGFNDLVRPSFYGAWHHISIAAADDRKLDAEQNVVVAGPLCESCDVFTQDEDGFVSERELPVAQAGDLLILHDAGAYGMAMSSNYNSRRIAAELLIDRGEIKVIRERQTFDALMQFERIPEDL